MKLFIGGIWYEDCDPQMAIAGTSRERAEEYLHKAMDKEVACCEQMRTLPVEYRGVADSELLTDGIHEVAEDPFELLPEQLVELAKHGAIYITD